MLLDVQNILEDYPIDSISAIDTVSCENLFLSEAVKKRLNETPTVNVNQFIKELKTSDIILVKRPKYLELKSSPLKNVISKLMFKLQRSPYSSCKIYGENGKLFGYGIGEGNKALQFRDYSAEVYIHRLQNAIIMRHVELTEEIRAKILEDCRSVMNLRYNTRQMILSAFVRLLMKFNVPVKSVETLEKAILTEELNSSDLEPVICSNIIAMFYIRNGLDIGVNMDWTRIWPVDFLISPMFQSIVKIER